MRKVNCESEPRRTPTCAPRPLWRRLQPRAQQQPRSLRAKPPSPPPGQLLGSLRCECKPTDGSRLGRAAGRRRSDALPFPAPSHLFRVPTSLFWGTFPLIPWYPMALLTRMALRHAPRRAAGHLRRACRPSVRQRIFTPRHRSPRVAARRLTSPAVRRRMPSAVACAVSPPSEIGSRSMWTSVGLRPP